MANPEETSSSSSSSDTTHYRETRVEGNAFSDSNIIVGGSAPITIVNSVQQNMGAMQKRMQEERTASESESESTSSSESESESTSSSESESGGFPRKKKCVRRNIVRRNHVSGGNIFVGGSEPITIVN
eukprot:CAMPEP_0113852614 /NCGR_PEP_ID=MMETSP0372-20130328/5656_1 /TAXON_ID=340204 /ORGANISM="Lankesteria abbotti" /LENGTH=127 /DNA_ID=CAMNT_0000824279 /DNA_START=109 /DNA_END=489 /DNA_ORIENTATION=- /assembly_acc=CAM_ASM_000359